MRINCGLQYTFKTRTPPFFSATPTLSPNGLPPPPSCHAVYDVTRRETFDDLEGVWMKEVDMYSTVEDAIKMVVANKVDMVGGQTGGEGRGLWV